MREKTIQVMWKGKIANKEDTRFCKNVAKNWRKVTELKKCDREYEYKGVDNGWENSL